MLSRAGPLGEFGILFTPAAMVVAQTILVAPIIAALTRQVIEALWSEYREQLQSLGAGVIRVIPTLLWEGRLSLTTALLAGLGRAMAEVDATQNGKWPCREGVCCAVSIPVGLLSLKKKQISLITP